MWLRQNPYDSHHWCILVRKQQLRKSWNTKSNKNVNQYRFWIEWQPSSFLTYSATDIAFMKSFASFLYWKLFSTDNYRNSTHGFHQNNFSATRKDILVYTPWFIFRSVVPLQLFRAWHSGRKQTPLLFPLTKTRVDKGTGLHNTVCCKLWWPFQGMFIITKLLTRPKITPTENRNIKHLIFDTSVPVEICLSLNNCTIHSVLLTYTQFICSEAHMRNHIHIYMTKSWYIY